MAVTLVFGPDPTPGSKGASWDVLFGDTRRPAWTLTLTMAAVGADRFRCTGVRFEAHGRDAEELPVKWVARFPLARCLREARLACEEVLVEGTDPEALGADLPFGFPNRANRRAWYPALLACVESWQRLGMTPMETYREVHRRKRVPVNRVKQWVHVAKKLEEEEK